MRCVPRPVSHRAWGSAGSAPVGRCQSVDAEHRAGDQIAAPDGVVVRVEGELAAAVDEHTLALCAADDSGTPRFGFTTLDN